MPNPDNEPQIPRNQSEIIDSRTGLVSRDWYRFFLNLLNKANTGGGGSGTVTSVGLSMPTDFAVTGSPVTGSGTLTAAWASQSANLVFASPNGSAGVPTFRAVVAADIPTLNQNTTGSAATLTTGRTISISGDLTYTSPSFNGSANVTAAGTLATVNADVGSFTNASITVNGKGLITAASSGTAPVTSVTGTSPVSSSGGATPAISLASGYGDTQNPYASKTANFVLAAPNGAAGVPTFRAVVAADIPTLNQNTTGTAANVTGTVAIANGGSGQTTAQTAMNAFAGATTSGQYLRGNGTNVVMSTIQAGDVPTLNQNTTGTAANVTGTVAIANGGTGLTTAPTNGQIDIGSTGVGFVRTTLTAGTGISVTNAAGSVTITNTSPSSGGTVTSVTGTSPVSVATGTTTPVISLASGYGDTQNPYASKTANFFLAAPNGAAGVPTFRAIVATDVPTLNQNTTGTAANVTGTVAIANGGSGQTTAQTAMNAFAGATTSGSYLRGNGTNVVMATIQAADVPTLNQNTTGTASNVTGTVAIANGGTGQTTAVAAFDALSPTTTKGDLIVSNGTDNVRQAVGTDTFVLTADSTTATGVKWAASGTGLNISNDTTTATNLYPTFVTATTGTTTTINTGNAKLLYKPSTGELTSTHLVASNGIFVNSLTVATSYTIPAGSSGMSAGTISINNGVTVTVSNGSRWVVV